MNYKPMLVSSALIAALIIFTKILAESKIWVEGAINGQRCISGCENETLLQLFI